MGTKEKDAVAGFGDPKGQRSALIVHPEPGVKRTEISGFLSDVDSRSARLHDRPSF